jgi:hypothetical protein
MQHRLLPPLFFVSKFFGIILSAGLAVTAANGAGPAEASRVQSLDGQWRVVFDPQDAGKTAG